jgi:hypothetical protein
MARNSTVPLTARNQTDQAAAALAARLARSDLRWLGRGLLKGLRLVWRGRPMKTEHATTAETPEPAGPFRASRRAQAGDLLLWVPRGIDSYLIDDLTGGYGYSHTTIDLGEVDLLTGRPVMAEITVGQTVRRKFIDEYGQRAYARVPLSHAGVNVREFLECVQSKMGERYDTWDALTLGEITDPAKEVCSGLAADCLPENQLREIARARQLGLLHRGSVSVHSKLDAPRIRAFVSPNALAEYYGAPRGRKVTSPDTLVQPRPVGGTMGRTVQTAARRHGWRLAAGLATVVLVGFVIIRKAS